MKKSILFSALFSAAFAFCGCSDTSCNSEKLVILHTNDTHSQIEPDSKGLGGVMRRKAVLDSVRAAEKNVLLVDAGDAVQGTLFFYLYGGKVEQELMNLLDVNIRILGNHEFDNGIDSLAKVLSLSDAEKISTNYNLDNTPLKGLFQPYSIKEYCGKRIGFLGINLNPDGIITPGNYDGLKFEPIVATANAAAKKLKTDEGVDAVIALTHIGYNPKGLDGDSILATNSHDIDIIIGGHSHDTIDPSTEIGARRCRLTNLDGEEVLVVQTGKAGRYLGKIEIDLDSLTLGGSPKYELIRIDNRYDSYNNADLAQTIDKYSQGVDSLMHLWVGSTSKELKNSEPELLNYFTDFIFDAGSLLAPNIDLAIANKGGLRCNIPAGQFSKGHIINMIPFSNYVTVLDIKGSDLLDVFEVMAKDGGNGISRGVRATYSPVGLGKATINGKAINPSKTYRVATIDYLAKGGDYMTGLTHGTIIAQSALPVYEEMLKYLTEGKGSKSEMGGDPIARWTSVK